MYEEDDEMMFRPRKQVKVKKMKTKKQDGKSRRKSNDDE